MTDTNLPAGRELDERVAVEAMGWRRGKQAYGEMAFYEPPPNRMNRDREQGWVSVPAYSTDIAAAWQVVEHLWDSKGLTVQMGRSYGLTGQSKGWYCWFGAFDDGAHALCPTMSEAICRAALAAVAE